jgi:hypothetical protein
VRAGEFGGCSLTSGGGFGGEAEYAEADCSLRERPGLSSSSCSGSTDLLFSTSFCPIPPLVADQVGLGASKDARGFSPAPVGIVAGRIGGGASAEGGFGVVDLFVARVSNCERRDETGFY